MDRAVASERAPGVLGRIDGLIHRAKGAAALLATTLALSAAGAIIENAFDTAAANAQTPTRTSDKPEQVNEYVKVIASDAGGDALPKIKILKTFVFVEQCKDNSRSVTRKVVYNQANQPLGKCDEGSPVTITEKQPLRGDWLHQSSTKKIPKATLKNNRSVFIEQAKGGSVAPSSPAPAASAPAPAVPIQPTPPPGGETPPPPADPYASGNVGVDISWPQCGSPDATPSGADFGIVGVTSGIGYSTNACLGPEAANFPGKKLNLYANTGWNSSSSHINPDNPRSCGTGDENCLAYNYGFNAGTYAANAAANLGITVGTRWWLDVESDATWSDDTLQNQNSLQGEYDALMAAGATGVGAYSTTVQWDNITGAWHNNWPSWGSTTWETAADAQTYCTGHEFTGGPSELMQFLPPGQIDHNVAC